MKLIKGRLRSSAIGRNTTELEPIMKNETRWSGKHSMLKRFSEIRDPLMKACDDAGLDITSIGNEAFSVKVKKYERMLHPINIATKELQSNGATVAKCRDILDSIIEAVDCEKNIRNSPLYGCKLDGKYIAHDSSIIQYPDFERGVTKIQNGATNSLTLSERKSVKMLLSTNEVEEEDIEVSEMISIRERIAKRQKMSHHRDEYINCDFILGSVAEVERVWSISEYILSNHRRSLTPRTLEALVFLRYNEKYWNLELVCEALKNARRSLAE